MYEGNFQNICTGIISDCQRRNQRKRIRFIEKDKGVFSSPNSLVEDMFIKEERQKVLEKKKEIKDAGFKAVYRMLEHGYTLKSYNDIINSVASAMDRMKKIKASPKKDASKTPKDKEEKKEEVKERESK